MNGASIKTEPLWTDQAPMPEAFGRDALPEKADVAVIGGGYTGLIAARVLAMAGASVVVLEKNRLGWGASSRNGGKALVGLKPAASSLVKRYGPDLGKTLWKASLEGIDRVEHLVREASIDCDFERCGSFFGAVKPRHFDAMRRESDWLSKNFGYEQKIIPRNKMGEEIGTSLYHGGAVDEKSAGLHPAKYVNGLARAAKSSGVRLCDRTGVKAIVRENGGFAVETPAGRLSAKHVLIATNGYTDGSAPKLRSKVIAIGSYIIATEPLPPGVQKSISPRGRMFYDSKWFLNYFRLTPDGRILFGGRTALTPDQDLNASANMLRSGMIQMFPQLKEVRVTHSWSGNLGLTFDMLPHIGRADGAWYALGYSGHGVALSAYLGTHVAELMQGKRKTSPFMEIKHPEYFFYRGRAWFRPFLAAGLRMLDWVT